MTGGGGGGRQIYYSAISQRQVGALQAVNRLSFTWDRSTDGLGSFRHEADRHTRVTDRFSC